MNNKTILVLVGFSLAGGFALLSAAGKGGTKPSFLRPLEQTSPQAIAQDPIAQDPRTLSARIKIAKARGEQQITFPAPIPIYDDINSLDEAVMNYEIVVARPLEKISFMLDPQHITSFYRLQIIEALTPIKIAKCCFPKSAPKELLALNANELYLRTGGGSLMLDGVHVTVAEELGPLSQSRKYLLFLMRDTSGQFGMVKLGPYGVFEIGSDDRLQPIVKRPYLLQIDLEKRCGNSLQRLRTQVENRM